MKFNKIFITTFMLVVLTIGACSSEREVMSPQQPAPAPTAAPAIATAPPPSAPLAPSQPSAPDQPAPAAEPAPTPTSEPVTVLPVVENKKQSVGSEFTEVLSNIGEIVDPTNINWPRIISINGDEIVINEKPEKVLTISLGHDEILFGISNKDQIVGTTTFAQDDGSNIQDESLGMPTVTTDPESIIVLSPDVVFADAYASVDLMDSLEDLGITVIQTPLNNGIEGRKNDVWLMAYITGNLEQASELVSDIDSKINKINDFSKNEEVQKRVLTLSWWDSYWTAGTGSTEDSIITLAGAVNTAAENGIESNTTIDKEKLISMNPEVILITQSVSWGGQDFFDQLMSDNSLSSIDAIKNEQVFMVNPNWWGTLSYWNILGSKELIEILLPDSDFESFGDF